MPSPFRPGAATLAFLIAAAILSACASAPLTPFSAGERAARLANDQCQQRYGQRPFYADDYEAEFVAGRWNWGGEGGQDVDGFSVYVSFEPDGRRARVEVDRSETRGNPDGL